MFAGDLKSIGHVNYLLKYAGDSVTICHKKSVASAEDEMVSISRWSTENKLLINLLKIKEMIFRRPTQ